MEQLPLFNDPELPPIDLTHSFDLDDKTTIVTNLPLENIDKVEELINKLLGQILENNKNVPNFDSFVKAPMNEEKPNKFTKKIKKTNLSEKITKVQKSTTDESRPLNTELRSIPVTPVCKNYSRSSNVSPDYQYANQVTYPTCSDSRCGIMCSYEGIYSTCPFYQPDESVHSVLRFADPDNNIHDFTVTVSRCDHDIRLVTVTDVNDNVICTLNYNTQILAENSDSDVAEEVSNILSSYVHDMYSDSVTLKNIEKDEGVKTVSSNPSSYFNYIKSLTPA